MNMMHVKLHVSQPAAWLGVVVALFSASSALAQNYDSSGYEGYDTPRDERQWARESGMNMNQLPQVMGLAQQVFGQARNGGAVSPAAGQSMDNATIYNMGYRDGLSGVDASGRYSGNNIYMSGYRKGSAVRSQNPT